MDLKFVSELGKAITADDKIGVLLRYLDRYGYDRFAYAMVPTSPTTELGEYLSINNLDDDWMQYYAENELHKNDPLAIHCFYETKPLLWSTVFERGERGLLPQAQLEVSKLAWDRGFRTGVTIPLRQVGAFYAGISLFANSTHGDAKHDDVFKENETKIVEACDMFHARVDRKLLSMGLYNLTAREEEVLNLLSRGFLEKQIVHHTGRSIHTIQKQIRSAKRRLHAATPAQAVAKAVALGILN